jgi:hypothetical protein
VPPPVARPPLARTAAAGASERASRPEEAIAEDAAIPSPLDGNADAGFGA